MSGRPGEGRRIACGTERVVKRVLSLGRRRGDRASKLLVAVGDGMRVGVRVRVRVSGCRAGGEHSGFVRFEDDWVVSEDVK